MVGHRVSLQGQVAIVTGGGRGIGASIAVRLASLGTQVVICGRSQAPLTETAKKITAAGGRCEALVCDLSSPDSVTEFAGAFRSRFQRLDILVNNAGVGSFKTPLHQLELKDWNEVLDINLRGVYLMIKEFAPVMIKQSSGHIVNISSLAGKNALPNGAVYAASKWGLNGLTYSVAEELRAHNIRVAVICPGSVDTDLSPHAGKDKHKMLQPDDIAHAVEMLVTQTPQSFASEILLRPTLKP